MTRQRRRRHFRSNKIDNILTREKWVRWPTKEHKTTLHSIIVVLVEHNATLLAFSCHDSNTFMWPNQWHVKTKHHISYPKDSSGILIIDITKVWTFQRERKSKLASFKHLGGFGVWPRTQYRYHQPPVTLEPVPGRLVRCAKHMGDACIGSTTKRFEDVQIVPL